MKACEKNQGLFVDALYDELSAENKLALQDHLKECSACAADLAAMQSTLKVMSTRKRPEPEQEFWRNFDTKLQHRIQESTASPAPKIIPFHRHVPQWVWQAAAALVLIGLGVLIGRFYLKEEAAQPLVKQTPPAPQIRTVTADSETRRFLERSEVLLLGVVNTDPEDEDPYAADLAYQKKVSRDLILEAAQIKTSLKDPRQRRLRELVSDLEMILLQIANLEADQDQPEIEILKSGVDRKGLLLKISLEQLRLSDPEKKPEPSKRVEGPAI